MFERLNRVNNKKGGFAIIGVIAIFIIVLTIAAYISILSKTFTLGEIQSIMDISGVSALEKVVREKELKEEIFAINDESKVDTVDKKAFKLEDCKAEITTVYDTLINKAVNTNSNITYFKVNSHDVTFEYSGWGLGENASGKKRPQIILDTLATVKVKTSNAFNFNDSLERKFFNAKNNTSFTVNYQGKTENGESILLIRSVTRVVYR